MSDRYKIKAPLGPTFNTNPDDVWVVKNSLARSGFYKTPDYGMTPILLINSVWRIRLETSYPLSRTMHS